MSVAALSVGAVAINAVTPQPALAFVCDSTQNPVGDGGAVDTGVGGTATDNTACGRLASATNTTAVQGKATAVGWKATAVDDSVAVGANAQANVDQTTAIGRNALADHVGATAIGRNARAINDYAVSIGESSTASGNRSVAIGKLSNAAGNFSAAVGYNATINTGSTMSSAFGANAVIGANSPDSMAIGANTRVASNTPGAVAFGTDSTGQGAVATLSNQIVAGTARQTITAPGITSSLSRSRQTGPLEVVTSDANGNLATDGGQIFRNVDENRQGVALALAAVNPDLTGNERFGVTANWGTFKDANAFGMGVEGVLGHDWITRGDRIAVTGGWGVGFADGRGDDVFGGRVGAQWTWGGAPTTTVAYALPPIK